MGCGCNERREARLAASASHRWQLRLPDGQFVEFDDWLTALNAQQQQGGELTSMP